MRRYEYVTFQWDKSWPEPKPYQMWAKIAEFDKEDKFELVMAYDFERQDLLRWAFSRHIDETESQLSWLKIIYIYIDQLTFE